MSRHLVAHAIGSLAKMTVQKQNPAYYLQPNSV